MLCGCFNITVNASGGGMIIECKNCTQFGVSKCMFWFGKYNSFWYHILTLCCYLIFLYFQKRNWKSFNATFARGHILQCPGVAIEVCARLIQNSQAGRLTKKMIILTPPANSTLGGQSLTSVRKLGLLEDAKKNTKRFKQTSLILIVSWSGWKSTTILMGTFVFLKYMLAFLYFINRLASVFFQWRVLDQWMWNVRPSLSSIAFSPRTEIESLMKKKVVMFRAGQNLKHLHLS